MGILISYLSNTVIPDTKREKKSTRFNVFTQVGVKQLTDFLRTVTAASDLVDCTLVNCDIYRKARRLSRKSRQVLALNLIISKLLQPSITGKNYMLLSFNVHVAYGTRPLCYFEPLIPPGLNS